MFQILNLYQLSLAKNIIAEIWNVKRDKYEQIFKWVE